MINRDGVQRFPPPAGLASLGKEDIFGVYAWLCGRVALAQGRMGEARVCFEAFATVQPLALVTLPILLFRAHLWCIPIVWSRGASTSVHAGYLKRSRRGCEHHAHAWLQVVTRDHTHDSVRLVQGGSLSASNKGAPGSATTGDVGKVAVNSLVTASEV
jgi:hypothetical protein